MELGPRGIYFILILALLCHGWFYGEIFGLWEIKREKVYNSLMPFYAMGDFMVKFYDKIGKVLARKQRN